jgi:hypothetical protein
MEKHEEKLFQTIWRAIAGSFCVLVVTIASCTIATNQQDNNALVQVVQSAVQSGNDPMSARCAMNGLRSDVCLVIAAQKRPKE